MNTSDVRGQTFYYFPTISSRTLLRHFLFFFLFLRTLSVFQCVLVISIEGIENLIVITYFTFVLCMLFKHMHVVPSLRRCDKTTVITFFGILILLKPEKPFE